MRRVTASGDITKAVTINGRLLTSDTVVINTGSKASIDTSVPGMLDAKLMTYVKLPDLNTLLDHLIILGGGYVGLAFAQAFARLGAKVTVVDSRSSAERLIKYI
jgi:pyruvate/2-oxoglutarate dehydrogenase complex dihydrolipoamide dehydrogenase (E3) component